MTRKFGSPYTRVIMHAGDLVEPKLTREQAAQMVRDHTRMVAKTLLTGIIVTPDTRFDSIDTRNVLPRAELGAAMLLACQGGPYADPTVADLFDGWELAETQRDALPPHLRLAAEIGRWFAGTVRELTDIVDAVLTATTV